MEELLCAISQPVSQTVSLPLIWMAATVRMVGGGSISSGAIVSYGWSNWLTDEMESDYWLNLDV